ncbi:MAG TPA: hypothetical protein VHY59_03815, partial [Chthoniobacterales bacterium]|nr:hypothetical protein [Chthoniobacterales bacterium]
FEGLAKAGRRIFFTEDNEGNEGMRSNGHKRREPNVRIYRLFAPVENLLSEHSLTRPAKLKCYTNAKSKTEERELAQRPLTATEYGFGGYPFVAFVIFCKKISVL